MRQTLEPSTPEGLDRALDWTVAPGYSTVGYRVRSRGWKGIPASALAGQTVLVTGATSGIGESASAHLARLGARVHMVAREPNRGVEAVDRVARRVAAAGDGEEERLQLELCDLSDMDSVRSFAAGFGARVPRLHGVLHNAGVLRPHREWSAQGHELSFATNVLGPFLLTELLMTALRRGSPSRVVLVSSGGMYTARLSHDDLELHQREFDGPRFYAHTKRIEVILAGLWAERERTNGVSFASVHPGWVDTPGLKSSLPGFHRLMRPLLRDPDQGSDTAVWLLATDAAAREPGAFWHDRRPRPQHRVPWTRETAAERAELMARLTGLAEERG